MYRPKRSKDFFKNFYVSFFSFLFLSLSFQKKNQMTTFCTKPVFDFGHHYRISGKSDWDDTF